MLKRKGQTNGSRTRNKTSSAASGNAPEIDAAGAPSTADSATVDTASLVAGSDGVDGAADGKGLSDGKTSGKLEAGEGATPGAGTETADPGGEDVSGDIGAGSGSGSIENDGDASADGAADDGKNGSVSGETDDQAGSVGGGNTHAADGVDGASSGNDNNPEHVGGGNSDENVSGDDADGSKISPDLKAALELAGCETPEDLVDMARIGSNLIIAIDDIRRCEGPFNSWQPMDDPTEIVHDLYAALEHAWEKAAAPALDPEGNPPSSEAPPEVDCCPICDVPFKPDDVCATDVTEGTCHAECLAGTPVVDLETGKPHDGPICTFLYSDDVPGMPAATIGAEMAIMDNLAGSAMLSAEFAWDGAWDAFFTHTHPETCADGQPEFPLSPIMGRDLAEYVRRIGRRATPEILVQQLVILKHRQSADLSEQERIALRTFVATLLDLDDFAAAEKKRLDELAAEKPEPKPLPIEDTTMETVAGTLDTF